MGDYMTLYKKKGKRFDEREKTIIKEFWEGWKWMSWRSVQAKYDIDIVMTKSDLLNAVSGLMEVGVKSMLKNVSEDLDDVREIIKAYDFLVDVLWLYLNVDGIIVGSEYFEDDEWERMEVV